MTRDSGSRAERQDRNGLGPEDGRTAPEEGHRPTSPEDIINRLKELLAKATPLENWQELFDALGLTPGNAYPRLISALVTNLTPSGVERIRAAAFEEAAKVADAEASHHEGKTDSHDRHLVSHCTAKRLAASIRALALPSEPPSQGDVEGRARELAAAIMVAVRQARFPREYAAEAHDEFEALTLRPTLAKALASKEDGRS